MRRLFFALVIGCSGAPAPTELPPPSTTPAARPQLCLPLLSACGCATPFCARGERQADGRYSVFHAGQDSRIDSATLETWCFTPEGVRSSDGADPSAVCEEVFVEDLPCGGECIPLRLPTCTGVGDSCQAG